MLDYYIHFLPKARVVIERITKPHTSPDNFFAPTMRKERVKSHHTFTFPSSHNNSLVKRLS